MRYQRSLEIEQRLDDVLNLIRNGNYSTPTLAAEIGVSIPTISRAVEALRGRGHSIRAEKHSDGWRYVLGQECPECKPSAPNRHSRRDYFGSAAKG